MVRQSGRGAVVPLQARQAATEPAERSLGTGTGATHGDVAYVSPGFRTPLAQPCSRRRAELDGNAAEVLLVANGPSDR